MTKELAQKLHEAQKITAIPGPSNRGLASRLIGAYLTIRKGLTVETVFIGWDTNKDCEVIHRELEPTI